LATEILERFRAALSSVENPPLVDEERLQLAAVAVILAPFHGEMSVCMILRSEHPEDPWSGHMAFPGGRRDPGDADSLATAIRETEEEIGLALSRAQCLGALAPVRVPIRVGTGPMAIETFVFGLEEAIVADPNEEVAGVFHFPLSKLQEREGRSFFDYDHRGALLRLECIDQQGCRIWGLSLRILDDLLERLSGC